jgi:MerR family transcriptional regulator, heat shock protein HspR
VEDRLVSVDFGPERALFSISVASELTGVHPQALRGYESRGLVTPQRTDGGTRRYSGEDVERIGRISTLLADGHNLAGVQQILELEAEVERLRAELERLRRQRAR